MPQSGDAAGEAPANLYATVHDARTKWQAAPEVPRVLQQDLAARYHQAIGRLVGTVAAPLSGLVTALNNLPAGLARQLQAIVDQGLIGGGAAAAPAAEAAEAPTSTETPTED